MTVIDIVTCPCCGDKQEVVCEHEGKECEHCGVAFSSEGAREEHEQDCEWKDGEPDWHYR